MKENKRWETEAMKKGEGIKGEKRREEHWRREEKGRRERAVEKAGRRKERYEKNQVSFDVNSEGQVSCLTYGYEIALPRRQSGEVAQTKREAPKPISSSPRKEENILISLIKFGEKKEA